jgi:uncharacterized protein
MPLADSIPSEAQSSFPRRMPVFAGIAAIQESAMLRDDSGNGGGRPSSPRNVLGDRLDVCSMEPKTGFFRDGCCNTNGEDIGSHTVCAVMTAEFLEFSKSRGNDLSTPMPQFGFTGPEAGRPLVLVCAPLARSAGGGLCTPRGLAGYSRRRPRPLLARRSQAIRPGPRLSSTIAPGARMPRKGDELGGGSASQAPLSLRPSADGWRPPSLQSEPTASN